ncbi:MAG: hypothetical protein OEM39_00210 [Acidimicrobiia bacterium]|nr:hypothetical protein [Acidimicrobiia bacterium]
MSVSPKAANNLARGTTIRLPTRITGTPAKAPSSAADWYARLRPTPNSFAASGIVRVAFDGLESFGSDPNGRDS